MSTKSKFKGRVVCTKAQYEALAEKDPDKEYLITDDDTFAKTDEENAFTAPNRFKAEVQFDAGLSSDGDIIANNKVVKVLDSTQNGDGTNKDLVTQYAADEIYREEDTTVYRHKYPNKSGTLALEEDLEGKLNVLAQQETNRVYVRTEAGVDNSLPYTYSAEADSIPLRNAAGKMQTETPTLDDDCSNKKYVDDNLSNKENILIPGSKIVITRDTYIINDQFIHPAQQIDTLINFESWSESESSIISYFSITINSTGEIIYQNESATTTVANADGTWVSDKYKTISFQTDPEGELLTWLNTNASKVTNIKAVQNYIDLSGDQGDLDDAQYRMLQGDSTVILRLSGVEYRLQSKPLNGSGNYVFISRIYNTEYADYIIELKTDKSWKLVLKPIIMPANNGTDGQILQSNGTNTPEWVNQTESQTTAPFVIIEPNTATNGSFEEDDVDYNNLIDNDDTYIILNNEYYYLSDNNHTEGIRSYVHTGWNGTSMQDKSINITLSTRAWTLKTGGTNTFEHIIKVSGSSDETGDEYQFMFIFNSNQSTPATTQRELTNLIGEKEIPVSGYRKTGGVYYPVLSVKGTTYYYLNSTTGKSVAGIASLTSYAVEDIVQ